jgi:hypothetical protein
MYKLPVRKQWYASCLEIVGNININPAIRMKRPYRLHLFARSQNRHLASVPVCRETSISKKKTVTMVTLQW